MSLFSQWRARLTADETITLRQIRESFTSGRLIPFVGTGLSMCEPNFPSWSDILEPLAIELSEDDRAHFSKLRENHLERAEFFARRKGHRALCYKIQDELTAIENALCLARRARGETLECHRRLVRQFNRIYTTNYDHLFEIACQHERCIAAPIFDAKSAETRRREWCQQYRFSAWRPAPRGLGATDRTPRVVQIVKFHGDYTDHNSMVITESDYYRRLMDIDAKDVMFMADLLFRDILFIGYRFGDTDLKYTFHQLGRLMDEVEREFPDRRRPGRLFLVTIEENMARAEYLRAAYGLSTLCIRSLSKFENGQVTYIPRRDDKEKSRWNGERIQLAAFGDLFSLAEAEPRNAGPLTEQALGPLYEVAQRILVTGNRSLSSKRCRTLQRIAARQGFRNLRTRVIRACYLEFINKMFRRT